MDEWAKILIAQLCKHIMFMSQMCLTVVKADSAKIPCSIFVCSIVETGKFVKVMAVSRFFVPKKMIVEKSFKF